MTVVVNSTSGLTENLPDDQANAALSAGSHEVPLIDPQGNYGSAPMGDAASLLKQGYRQPNPGELQEQVNTSLNQDPIEKTKAFAEGAAEGAAGPFGTAALKILGDTDEGINRRRESGYHTAGELAGFGASALAGTGEAAVLSKIGEGVSGLGEATSIGGRIASKAAQLATENALLVGGDEISRFITNDPNASVSSAASAVGLSGVLGGITGAGLGVVSPLWSMVSGSNAAKFIADAAGRVKDRALNMSPIQGLVDEMSNHYETMKKAASEVFGPIGLKAQAVEAMMPEANDAILNQSQGILSSLKDRVAEMRANPGAFPESSVNMLEEKVGQLESQISPTVDPVSNEVIRAPNAYDTFNALDNFKKTTQEWGQFNKDLVPLGEREFRNAAKDISYDLRNALEDQDVWGKAASAQKDINSAFKEYLPALQDFEKRFTAKMADGTHVIDPGKVNTYYNQLGKPSAEIKQGMLKDWLDQSNNYRNVIDSIHDRLGIDSPIEATPTNNMRATLDEITPGQKAADFLFNKSQLSGEVIGGGIGALVGHPAFGALIGEKALTPFLNSVLPALIKPIANMATSSEGLKAAANFGVAVVKGETALNRAANAMVKRNAEVLPAHLIPTNEDRKHLKEQINAALSNPQSAYNVGGHIGDYLPSHATAIGALTARSVGYLNGIKPNDQKMGLIDPKREVPQSEERQYNRQLDLAQQPLLALKYAKEGSLTNQDLKTIQAVHPDWYQHAAQKVSSTLFDGLIKDKELDPNSIIGMSKFIGQPISKTLMPQSIMANQMSLTGPQQSDQALPRGQGRAKPSIVGMRNIKLASRAQTRTNEAEET